ncbi:MAG: hypothetical protein ACI835_005754 [Planctomycetota bacterium]|jgi:hypothetical protein
MNPLSFRTMMRGSLIRSQFASAIALLLLAPCFVACTDSTDPNTPGDERPGPAPVVLIGLDGLEWDVVLLLLKQGRLPQMQALMTRGRYGTLESMLPTSSPIIWTSIATGQVADKHGIKSFLDKKTDPDNPRLYNNRDRKTKAIWNILSEDDRTVNVVGWWMTYPTEAIRGVMVAQTNVDPSGEDSQGGQLWKGTLYADVPGQVYPPSLQKTLLADLGRVDEELPALTRDIFSNIPGAEDGVPGILWQQSRWSIRADEIYRRVGNDLLRSRPDFDLFAIYIGGSDVLGHRYWRFLNPEHYRDRPSQADIDLASNLILDYYVHLDSVIGELVKSCGRDVNVMIVSDHGMGPLNVNTIYSPTLPVRKLRSGGHPNAPAGVFIAAGPDIASSLDAPEISSLQRSDLKPVGSVLDITPTLLAMFGIPLGDDMDGRVVREWMTTKASDRFESSSIPTHSPTGWRKDMIDVEDVDSAERIKQLHGLGYLDDDDGDK